MCYWNNDARKQWVISKMAVFCVHLVIEQPRTGAKSCVVCQVREAAWAVHHVQKHTLQPARRAAVLDQPSSLRPHCIDPLIRKYVQ